MTRVSTAGQTQLLLDTLLRNQERQAKLQIQVATLRTSSDFKGIARDTVTLLGARELEARTQQFLDGNAVLEQRLGTYNLTLQRLADIAQTLRQDVIKAIESNSAVALMDKVNAGFEDAAAMLNTRVDGQYIFAGTRTDKAPVNVTTPAALLGLAQTADAFDNNDLKVQTRISDNTVKEYGILADDIGTQLLDSFRRIMQFNAGTLPAGAGAFAPAAAFQSPLPKNQQDFLVAELATIQAAFDTLNQEVAKNGVHLQLVAETQERHRDDLLFTRTMINEIENIDPAEAVTQLNDSQLVLEASMQVLATLTRLSLLDFL